MRRLSFDQLDLEGHGGDEQTLDLAVYDGPGSAPTLEAFLAACGASATAGPRPPADWVRWGEIVAWVGERAGVDLPALGGCGVVLIRDAWNDVEVGIDTGTTFVWYHWSTSA